VTITATNADGSTTTANFGVGFTDVAPTVAADQPSVSAPVNTSATDTGTFSDYDDAVTISASTGTVTQVGTSSGTWSWSGTATAAPFTVTVTATNADGATAPTSFTVSPTSTTSNTATASNLSAPSIKYGTEYTESFAVTVSAGGTKPKGTVAVKAGSTTLCTVTLSLGRGKCSLSATELPVGSYGVTATFNPSTSAWVSSTSPSRPLVVKAAATVTTLRPSASTISYGLENAEAFTLSVSAVGAKPQGAVSVMAGASTLCTAPLSGGTGTCSLTATQLPPGVYSLKAVYVPSSPNFAASSSTYALTVRTPS
jgi:hypothetical protein